MSINPMDGENGWDLNDNPRSGWAKGTGFRIDWQNGPRGVDGNGNLMPMTGASMEDIIEVLMMRIKFYQASKFSCVENADALDYLGRAHERLSDRQRRRERNNILGTNEVDKVEGKDNYGSDGPEKEDPIEPKVSVGSSDPPNPVSAWPPPDYVEMEHTHIREDGTFMHTSHSHGPTYIVDHIHLVKGLRRYIEVCNWPSNAPNTPTYDSKEGPDNDDKPHVPQRILSNYPPLNQEPTMPHYQ